VNPTIKDVAREARVSTATVSRVVNKDTRITPATRARVEAVIERLNYKVNTVARSLKSKRTLTVALLAPEIANVFFMR
jgi:LacI family transcriptional regulator